MAVKRLSHNRTDRQMWRSSSGFGRAAIGHPAGAWAGPMAGQDSRKDNRKVTETGTPAEKSVGVFYCATVLTREDLITAIRKLRPL